MSKIISILILCFGVQIAQAQWSHSGVVNGSVNYKGYQTGFGYAAENKGHVIQFGLLKNESVDRLFRGNHIGATFSYSYRLNREKVISFGPELDYQKMWFSKIDNRYNDSRTVSVAYFMRWQMTDHFALSNSLGMGGYVERFYYQNEENPEYFRGIGGLVKLQLYYTF